MSHEKITKHIKNLLVCVSQCWCVYETDVAGLRQKHVKVNPLMFSGHVIQRLGALALGCTSHSGRLHASMYLLFFCVSLETAKGHQRFNANLLTSATK